VAAVAAVGVDAAVDDEGAAHDQVDTPAAVAAGPSPFLSEVP
jgi:hypothetical protein